jgi:hypothetical protein
MGMASRIIVPDAKPAPAINEQAQMKAELAAKAFVSINECGSGLVAAAQACEANTVTLQTVYVLVVCQAYLQDAIAALLEREGSGILDSKG